MKKNDRGVLPEHEPNMFNKLIINVLILAGFDPLDALPYYCRYAALG